MTGKECFQTDPSEMGQKDRKAYRFYENMPLALQRWWQGRAELPEFDGPLDWNKIKQAVRG